MENQLVKNMENQLGFGFREIVENQMEKQTESYMEIGFWKGLGT